MHNGSMDVKDAILERKKKAGSMAELARQCGCSRMYLYGVLKGKWGASDKLLGSLGLKRLERVVRA